MDPEEEKDEYATQFFDFTPQAFTDGIYNILYDYIHDAITVLQTTLKHEFKSISDKEVESGSEAIINKVEKTANAAFDKLERYLRGILCIPDHCLLPEDRVHARVSFAKTQEQALDRQIANICKKLRNAKYLQAVLQNELQEIDLANQACDKILSCLDTMDELLKKNEIADMKESITYNIAKAMELVKAAYQLGAESQPDGSKSDDESNPSSPKKMRI